jgi:hypothetical protein
MRRPRNGRTATLKAIQPIIATGFPLVRKILASMRACSRNMFASREQIDLAFVAITLCNGGDKVNDP